MIHEACRGFRSGSFDVIMMLVKTVLLLNCIGTLLKNQLLHQFGTKKTW